MADYKAQAQHAAEDAVDEAVREARNMKDEADGIMGQYVNQARQLQDDVMTEIQDRPLRTLAIAVAFGFAIGAIWKT